MKHKSRGDESEDSREESSGGGGRASPPHAGGVCSDGDDEEEANTQVARDSGRGSDGDDSLNDFAGEDESFEGTELRRYHASWDEWEDYRASYCETESAHLVVQGTESVAKRNKQTAGVQAG
ncbi:hypothetical protein JG688_00018346 [Phytophthora aleatoria]|uniref:Uncharacterized protein n=1 Tax=Phytophthora aleatoria TaxID=2496075 RepID=A0A8J5IWA0_9STRA|nr:hypothetical protein JG688_00018346 [Phytophthora aleatoria]